MIDYDYALIAIHERPDRRFSNACVVVDLSFGRPQHKALCLRCGFNRVTLLLRVSATLKYDIDKCTVVRHIYIALTADPYS